MILEKSIRLKKINKREETNINELKNYDFDLNKYSFIFFEKLFILFLIYLQKKSIYYTLIKSKNKKKLIY